MPGLEQSLWLIGCNHSDEACMLGGEGEAMGGGALRARGHLMWKRRQEQDREALETSSSRTGFPESVEARKEASSSSSGSKGHR